MYPVSTSIASTHATKATFILFLASQDSLPNKKCLTLFYLTKLTGIISRVSVIIPTQEENQEKAIVFIVFLID